MLWLNWTAGIKFIPLKIKRQEQAAIDGLTWLFTGRRQMQDKEKRLLLEKLYKEIGQLKVELKKFKKSGLISEG